MVCGHPPWKITRQRKEYLSYHENITLFKTTWWVTFAKNQIYDQLELNLNIKKLLLLLLLVL